jgi:hypothetical protein
VSPDKEGGWERLSGDKGFFLLQLNRDRSCFTVTK